MSQMFRYVIACLFVAAVVCASAALFFPDYWIHRYDDLIARQARVYRLDEKLIWSLIYEETYFRACADELGLTLTDIAEFNVQKLAKRHNRAA